METRCVACEEVITNPICPACLQIGVQQWLHECGERRLAAKIHEVTREIFANHGYTFCIKCDNLMSLCAYCYTKEVFNLIRAKPTLVEQYLMFFNFDLEHQGWEHEARRYLDSDE